MRVCGFEDRQVVPHVLDLMLLPRIPSLVSRNPAAAFGALRAWLMSTFDWVFMSAGNLFVLFCLMLVVTPLGRVRLGGADAPAGLLPLCLVRHAVRCPG